MASHTSVVCPTHTVSGRQVSTLETYFLFPFALDKQAIRADHPQAWIGKPRWIDGVDAWIAGESGRRSATGMSQLGPWRRTRYCSFSVSSPAYSELLAFHSIVRQVFFDTDIGRRDDALQNQLRCYTIKLPTEGRLFLEGRDALESAARAQITDLRLYISNHGVGILSLGIDAGPLDLRSALWINRRLRKIYAVDEESIQCGGTPCWLGITLEQDGKSDILSEEKFDNPSMVGFYPPLSNTIKSLLYFADYSQEEYEPMLDENLFVYSYCELAADAFGSENAGSARDEFVQAFLYLNHTSDPGTASVTDDPDLLFGFTAHSFSLLTWIQPRAVAGSGRTADLLPAVQPHRPRELFHTRYYLMTIIALLYRSVLLDFTERGALVSRRLLQDQQRGRLTLASIEMVNDLRLEFLNFCSFWHFEELSCRESDNKLFRRLCCEFRISEMKRVLADELKQMGDFVYNFYQLRATDAVNRLAILSLIFGGGAVLTGFFGMNFGREFGRVLFEGEGTTPALHYLLVTTVCLFVFGSLALGTVVVVRNWRDYLTILNPPTGKDAASLKRDN